MAINPLQLSTYIPNIDITGQLAALGKTITDSVNNVDAAKTLANLYGGQPQQSLLSGLGQSPRPVAQPAPSNYASAIGSVESNNNYQAVGPQTSSGDRAFGKYQVMGANIPQWTKEVLGKSLTPQQFLADPQAQDAVFNAKFGQSVQKYGNPQDAASVWFSGRPVAQAGNASDGYNTVPQYVDKFNAALAQQGDGSIPQNATLTQGQAPQTAQQQPQPISRDQFQELAGNPTTRPLAMAILQSKMAGNQYQFMNVNGRIVATNPKTGQVQDVTPQGLTGTQYTQETDKAGNIWNINNATGQKVIALKASDDKEKNGGLMNVSAGGTVFDPKTRQPVFRNTADATLTDDATNTMADQYLAGDKSVLQNLGRGGQGAANLVKLRNTIQDRANARGMDGAAIAQSMISYVGDTARERTAATQEGRMVPAGIEASGAIELGRAASAQVPRTNWVPVNKALQAYERGTSDPKLRAFGAANTTIINTYARAINPNGVGTVADKEHAREMLSTADGPDAYNAVLDQMQKEIELAHTAPSQARAGFQQQRAARLNPQPSIQEGATATNQQTGQRIIFRGGQWQPVQ